MHNPSQAVSAKEVDDQQFMLIRGQFEVSKARNVNELQQN